MACHIPPKCFYIPNMDKFVLVTCFQLKNDKMGPWHVYHELFSSAHIFRKVNLRQ